MDFIAFSSCSSSAQEEDSARYVPRSARGSGGVAILWRKSLDHTIVKLPQFSNDRVVSIKLNTINRPVCFFASYLPTRSGGTDDFKAAMDFLDACRDQLARL